MRRIVQKAAGPGLAVSVALFLPAPAGPEPTGPGSSVVRLTDPAVAGAVQRAVKGASQRLGRSDCQRIFSEFRDRQGRPLQERLDIEGVSGPSFFGRVLFYDGSDHPRCRTKQVYAIARPGSRVVLICSEKFRETAIRRPRLAQAILIHEALHLLGLGEDPPSSAEITFRVTAHCGL